MHFDQNEKIFGQFSVYQMSFLGYQNDYILEIGSQGVKLISSKDECLFHSYKDIIKILPLYDTSEILVENYSKKTSKQYKCSEIQHLLSVYIRAIDEHIDQSRDSQFSHIIQSFQKFNLDWRVINTSEKSVYKVTLKIFRTHFKIYLISKKIYKKDANIIHGIDAKMSETSENSIIVYFHEIQSIINTFFGFIVSLKNSHQLLMFNCIDFGVKTQLISLIENNATKYLQNDINISENNPYDFIEREISQESLMKFWKKYTCLKITGFEDFVKINICINDSFLYEIEDNKIASKINIESIFKITESHDIYKAINIYFITGLSCSYIFPENNDSSFISFLQGTFLDLKVDQSSFSGIPFTLGHLDLSYCRIIGLNHNQKGRQTFEKKFLQDVNSPQFEEQTPDRQLYLLNLLCINFYFENASQIFTVKQFLKRFTKQLKSYFSMKNLIKQLKESEMELSSIFYSKINQQMTKKFQNNNSQDNINQEEDTEAIQADELRLVMEIRNNKPKWENVKISYKIWEIFTLMFRDENIFKEISSITNLSEQNKTYMQLFETVVRLLIQEDSQVFNYIASKFLLNFIDYHKSLPNIETLNKNFLLKKNEDIDFLQSISKYMTKILEYQDINDFLNKRIIHFDGILDIFLSIIFKKKISTHDEDLVKVINLLKSSLYFVSFVKLSQSNEPELVFKTSLLMNSIVECLGVKTKVQQYQNLILNNSTLLLRHIQFCVTDVSIKQKQSSILFIYHCLIDNVYSGALMLRLIPETLFNVIKQNFKNTQAWTLAMWEELFLILNQEHNTPTLQWNNESKNELLSIIAQEITHFNEHWKTLNTNQRKLILREMFQNDDFAVNQVTEDTILQLKWNYDEYNVSYQSLQKKLPIYQFYVDEIFCDCENPYLKINDVKGAKKFYEDLINTFIVNDQHEIKVKILKVLILLYKDYYLKIKDSSLITILLKNLQQNEKKFIHYLILQMLFTMINVQDELTRIKNYKMFIENDGIQILLQNIQQTLKQNDITKNLMNYSQIKTLYYKNKAQKSDEKRELSFSYKWENITFNFTNETLQQEAFTPEIQIANECIFCLKIYLLCIKMTKPQGQTSLLMIPRPLPKEIALLDSTIDLLYQLILSNDSEILNNTLGFISITYMDKFHFKRVIKNQWIIPLLIYKIEDNTIDVIGEFFISLYNNLLETEDEKIVKYLQDIKQLNFSSKINDLQIYGTKKSEIEGDIKQVFDSFIGLYYLPPYFWYTLLNKGTKKFSEKLFNVSHKSFLIWNQVAFQSLKSKLHKSLSQILDFKKLDCQFEPSFIKYSYADELISGPLILKNYIIDRRKKNKISKNNLKILKSMLSIKFTENLNKLKYVQFDSQSIKEILMNIHIILDVQGNIFKHYHNFIYKNYSYLQEFLEMYLAIASTYYEFDLEQPDLFQKQDNTIIENKSVLTIDQKRIRQSVFLNYNRNSSESSNENDSDDTLEDQEQNDDQFPFIQQSIEDLRLIQEDNLNLFDYCLINTLKLIKNTLDPQGNIRNFNKFNHNKTLKISILNLMQRNVIDVVKEREQYTFNRFQINFYFLGIMMNIYERNGYTLHSFGEVSLPTMYQIEHVFTNLDTQILEFFIEFIKNNQLKKQNLIVSQDKILEDKAFDIVEEEQENRKDVAESMENLEEIQSPRKEENQEQQALKKKRTSTTSELSISQMLQSSPLPNINKKKYFSVLPKSMKKVINDKNFKPKTEEDKFLLVQIQEIKRNSYKQLVKRLAFKEIKQMTGGFDFSRTIINREFFKNINKDYSMIYIELKSLLHETLKLWIYIVYKLSKNSKNSEKLIKSGLVMQCLKLSFFYNQIEPLADNQMLVENVNIFAKLSYKVFYNILMFCVLAVMLTDKDKYEFFKIEISSKKFQKMLNSAESIQMNKAFLKEFYQILMTFIGDKQLLSLIIGSKDHIEEIIGNHDNQEYSFSTEDINMITQKVNLQIMQNLKGQTFDSFPIFEKHYKDLLE